MSSSVRELEIDQEITKFALSFTKKIFARAGITQPHSIAPVPAPNNLLAPELPIRIDLPSSTINNSQSSPFKSSNSNSFSNDSGVRDYSSPVVSRPAYNPDLSESILISIEGTPTVIEEELSERKNSEEKEYEDTGVSYFSDDQDDTSSYQMPSVPLVAREEFSHRLQKEGWLEKKSTSMFVGWQKRYFKIKPFEISYAKTPEMMEARKDVRSVNLKAYICEVTAGKDNNFSIGIDKVQKKLNLRAESLREAIEWVDFLKEFFNYSKAHCYQDNKYHSRNRSRFSKLEMMTEDTFVQRTETGDVVIFAGGLVGLQKAQNKYEHVALVVRTADELFLYEASNEKDIRLIRWKDMIDNLHQKDSKTVFFRKLVIDNRETKDMITSRICDYITTRGETRLITALNTEKVLQTMSKSFETGNSRADTRTNTVNLTSSTPNFSQSSANMNPPVKSKSQSLEDEKSFSARLVASVYKSIGLLDATKSVAKYTPMSFIKPMNLLKGAYMLAEQEIVLLN